MLIVDWDVHHGNGTNEIFRDDPSVLFVSIHESPLYPGTGPASDLGSGAGEGYTVNLPVPPHSGDETFRSLIDHVVLPLMAAWEPQLVLVSAGFDAHSLDPLGELPRQRARLRGDDGVAAARVRGGRRAAGAGARGRLLARGADGLGGGADAGARGGVGAGGDGRGRRCTRSRRRPRSGWRRGGRAAFRS